MKGMFLTSDEVADLTGRKTPSKQIDALIAMGFKFEVQPAGRPVLLRAHVEERMGLNDAKSTGDAGLTDEPNRDAFRPDWEALERSERELQGRKAIRKANGDRRRAEKEARGLAREKHGNQFKTGDA